MVFIVAGQISKLTVAGYGFKARAVQRPADVRNGVVANLPNEIPTATALKKV